MKVLKRLNLKEVDAKLDYDFDTFFEIMKKHRKEAVDIVSKYLSPIFNKLPNPLNRAAEAYDRVAFNLAGAIVGQSYRNTVYFTIDVGNDMSSSITLDDKFQAECDFHVSTNFVDFKQIEQIARFTKALASISQKDFDLAIKKARGEMEKALEKWNNE